ncbi:MAG: nitroreductase family protein [Acidimicrobiales bacterium]
MDTLSVIAARRSTPRLNPPGPSPADLEAILIAAACAPDHCELRPWRFVVLEGEHKDAFGAVMAEAYLARSTERPTDGQLDKERRKLDRAPLVLVVAAVHRDHDNVPFTEQVCSAAAAAQNALLAATALGYGSMWRTGDAARDPAVAKVLGLGPADAVVAFLYLGTPPEDVVNEPRRSDLEALVTRWHSRTDQLGT